MISALTWQFSGLLIPVACSHLWTGHVCGSLALTAELGGGARLC